MTIVHLVATMSIVVVVTVVVFMHLVNMVWVFICVDHSEGYGLKNDCLGHNLLL